MQCTDTLISRTSSLLHGTHVKESQVHVTNSMCHVKTTTSRLAKRESWVQSTCKAHAARGITSITRIWMSKLQWASCWSEVAWLHMPVVNPWLTWHSHNPWLTWDSYNPWLTNHDSHKAHINHDSHKSHIRHDSHETHISHDSHKAGYEVLRTTCCCMSRKSNPVIERVKVLVRLTSRPPLTDDVAPVACGPLGVPTMLCSVVHHLDATAPPLCSVVHINWCPYTWMAI